MRWRWPSKRKDDESAGQRLSFGLLAGGPVYALLKSPLSFLL